MEVEREVVLDAPPAEVWEALTDEQQLEEWFANDVEFDLDRGGVFRWDDGELFICLAQLQMWESHRSPANAQELAVQDCK